MLRGKCGFCKKAAVAVTTYESRDKVCEDHYLVAAMNGMLPKKPNQPALSAIEAHYIQKNSTGASAIDAVVETALREAC